MASPSMSKVRYFLNHAPVWQRAMASGISFCLVGFVSKVVIFRLRTGVWDMDWADKFGESLFGGILFGLVSPWLMRKGVSSNNNNEQRP
jgi:hypothetical protein